MLCIFCTENINFFIGVTWITCLKRFLVIGGDVAFIGDHVDCLLVDIES